MHNAAPVGLLFTLQRLDFKVACNLYLLHSVGARLPAD